LLLCVAASAVAIPLAVWVFLPEMQTYRGLSGIDSAAFALLAVLIFRDNVRTRRWYWAVFACAGFLAFGAKIVFELTTGGMAFVDGSAAGMVPVPLAHLIGAGAGVVAGFVPIVPRRACPLLPALFTLSSVKTGCGRRKAPPRSSSSGHRAGGAKLRRALLHRAIVRPANEGCRSAAV